MNIRTQNNILTHIHRILIVKLSYEVRVKNGYRYQKSISREKLRLINLSEKHSSTKLN